MSRFNLISILSLLLAFSFQLIKASTAYYKLNLFIHNPTSTTTIYVSLDNNLVTGVYNTLSDFISAVNNVIPAGGYYYNDNKLVLPPYNRINYGFTSNGISFKNASTSFCLSADTTVNPPVLNLLSSLGFFSTLSATATYIPIEYYILTVPALPIRYHYLAVVLTRVVGVYSSIADIQAQTNNVLVPYRGYEGNDNKFVYTAGPPFYGVTDAGISFTVYNSIYINIYTSLSLSSSQLLVIGTDITGTYGPTAVTVTVFPADYYTLTINTNPIITKYIAVEVNHVIGVFDTLADISFPLKNHIYVEGSFSDNDNILDYTAGAPYYGITDGGISYNNGGESVNINNPYTGGQLHLVAYGYLYFASTAVTVTVTPIPTQYYILTISSTPPRVFYITVVSTLITGVYASLDDMYALVNNLALLAHTYKDNDNSFDYTASAPYYGLTHSGVSFLLDGNDANLYLLPLMYPSLFLYFDYGGLAYNIPVTVTVESISPTSAPTSIPTTTPSRAPTALPTKPPTRQPSRAPTKTPTKAPSKQPSRGPTKTPTRAPTKQPTNTPTGAPTA